MVSEADGMKQMMRLLKSNNAQALAEFAVVFPVQLLITLGIAQFALVIYARDIVTYAAHQAAWAERVGEDSHAAAYMVCSPITGMTTGGRQGRKEPENSFSTPGSSSMTYRWPGAVDGQTGPGGDNVVWPGWGELRRSGISALKTHVSVITPHTEDEDYVEVSVMHEYELIIPFVNWIFSSHRIGGIPHLGIVRTARAPKYSAGHDNDALTHPPIREMEEEE